jgi:sialic acid synthase SpsE
MPGPDHRASLEPAELSAMVRAIRNVEQSLGDGIKAPAPCEAKNIAAARKSVVAERDIMRGERITRENVAIKRPGSGIQPADLEKVLGLAVTADIEAGSAVTWEDLK